MGNLKWKDISAAPKDRKIILKLNKPWKTIVIAQWYEPLSAWVEELPFNENDGRFGIGNQIPIGYIEIEELYNL